uniref:clpP1 n=1 Tax=Hypecoum erectum TaxID=1655241 RepID=UPI0028FCE63E|nr:clpP1 [Hypecoum erectum]BET06339.1 clpP1 [Hypecoum erectum]
MPSGVPKVPFQIPGDEDSSWYDLYNRLHRQRALFLFKEVEEEIANQIIGLLVVLTIEDDTWDFHLFINSPGGWVIPGIGIYDTMNWIKPLVHTICAGEASSMGSVVLVGGEIGTRLAYPHAKVMIHQPSSSYFKGKNENSDLDSYQLLHLRRTLTKFYVQRTGQPRWVISADLERDVFMTAEETRAYGIVDLVGL